MSTQEKMVTVELPLVASITPFKLGKPIKVQLPEYIVEELATPHAAPHPSIDPGKYADEVFTYHPPSDAQKVRYEAVRKAAEVFARIVGAAVPYCPDRAVALRKVREAVMFANAGIALDHVLQMDDGACFTDPGEADPTGGEGA